MPDLLLLALLLVALDGALCRQPEQLMDVEVPASLHFMVIMLAVLSVSCILQMFCYDAKLCQTDMRLFAAYFPITSISV